MKAKTETTKQRGAIAVEFALLLPVLLVLVLGAMDYGWYFLCALSATNAAREGARAGTTVAGGDATKARTTVTTYLAGAGLAAQPTDIAAVVAGAPTTVTVDVSIHFKPLVGFVPLPSDGSGPVAHAHAAMQGAP